jgi:hypothetical protein
MRFPIVMALLLVSAQASTFAKDAPRLIVVVGASGSEEFQHPFGDWAARWEVVAKQARVDYQVIGLGSAANQTDHDRLQQAIAAHADQGQQPLWLVLIGHGTFDGKTARFNLRGQDVSSVELKSWLASVEAPLAVINCSSCSGPFLAELSALNRVIVTATKSGHEYNFARFGEHLAGAIGDKTADLDKDEQTSLLEAYLFASSRLREFYSKEGRLATEHPLLDDNGDKLGTPADWFQGLRVVKQTKSGAAVDGNLARQFVLVRSAREEKLPAEVRAKRDELERQLAELRQRKGMLSEAEYFAQLESLLVEISQLSQMPPVAGK